MPDRVLAALDALDDLASEPGAGVTFLLEPGDAVVVDNAVVLHNRAAYEDSADRVRCLARLWAR
jgi:alpha-ketoglutarate-dependent taurine dioxygenase